MSQVSKATHILFCDETGNTGSHFIDKNQPLYGEGGWFVSKQDAQRASQKVIELEKRAGFGSSEKKGSELIRLPEGQAFVYEVCKVLGQTRCIPFVYVVEKRYFVCSKLVETFFDPLYNSAIPTSDTWNPEKRQSDAEMFYSFSDLLIDEFAQAYRAKNGALVKANAEKWIVELTRANRVDDAARIKSCLNGIEYALRGEAEANKSADMPAGLDSLNLPSVYQVFQFIECHSPYKCDIVHDQTLSFEPVYSHIFNLYKQAPRVVVRMLDGREQVSGFENCCSLAYADSKSEPLIRASDYLLSGVARFIRLSIAGQPIPSDVTRIAFAGLGSFLCEVISAMHPSLGASPHLSSLMASQSWAQQVISRLIEELQNVELSPAAAAH